jgi:hypothetical protein
MTTQTLSLYIITAFSESTHVTTAIDTTLLCALADVRKAVDSYNADHNSCASGSNCDSDDDEVDWEDVGAQLEQTGHWLHHSGLTLVLKTKQFQLDARFFLKVVN